MCDKKNLNELDESISISELKYGFGNGNINFSLEPANCKPIDIALMTGQNETDKGCEEK